jgi:ectoine hydroxylase-related dioxygenase (phytanoyl-CoA dioxygenase family)
MFPDASTIKELELAGATCLRGVVSDAWRSRIADAIEADIRDPGPNRHNYQIRKGRFHGNSVCWPRHPDLMDYVFNSPLPEIAARLLGSEKINLLYDQLFIKEPGTEAPTPWHHDHCVWPLKGHQVISFWLALDRVDEVSGRVEFVAGSHRWEGLFQPEPFAKGGFGGERDPRFKPMPNIAEHRSRYEIIGWNLEPGDVVAFFSRTVHGASGNAATDRRRRGYTARYCGDDVTYDTTFKCPPWLVNPALADGDALDSDLFPVVWSNGKRSPPPDIEKVRSIADLRPAQAGKPIL